MALTLSIAGITLTSCNTKTQAEKDATENMEDATDKLEDATDDLSVATRAATAAEWQAFKDESTQMAEQNSKRIAELKADMNKNSATLDQAYADKVAELEQKNDELIAKANNFKNDANADWESFKEEFQTDMIELNEALKNVTINSKK